MGKTLLGTTDTPRDDLPLEPLPLQEEIDFILREAGRVLADKPRRDDVLSAWAGLRPLVRANAGDGEDTKSISREHTVAIGNNALVTVTGGKWTTYRAMAEDVLARCADSGLLEMRPAGATLNLRLVGAPDHAVGRVCESPGAHLYGSEAGLLATLPGAVNWLWRDIDQEGANGRGDGGSHGDLGRGLSEAMVRFAVRFEMARTVEDVLARRSRLLFLDARKAEALARPVAQLVAEERGRPVDDREVADFEALARRYRDPLHATALGRAVDWQRTMRG
jgi:glycerol-3-phosphate dehydrogenase